jgi:CheY-like chemotaxis protein
MATNTDALPGSGKRVLVVNDTQEILELFSDILEALGFETTLMSFAPRELDQIRSVRPDIVILDFVFGARELAGWQLLQKIRMDRELESLPVIVCSAAVREVMEQQGYLTEQGVLVVLKPFTVAQLEEVVRRAVEMADAGQPLAATAGTSDGAGRGSRTPRRRRRATTA